MYIANIWNNAHSRNKLDLSPETNGWTLDENQYQFYWFSGDQITSLDSELFGNESGILSSYQVQQFIENQDWFENVNGNKD